MQRKPRERWEVLDTLSDLAREHGWDGTPGNVPKCYVSGPMTGLPNFNEDSFNKASEMLRKTGWFVWSPVENDEERGIVLTGQSGGETFDFKAAMAVDLQQVCLADAVFVLPGWEESKGAGIEISVAHQMDVPVYSILSGRRIPDTSKDLDEALDILQGFQDIINAAAVAESLTPDYGQVIAFESGDRKNLPIGTGVVDYFPAALAAVAQVSKAGNDKHNPGQPMHWARGKSMDHADCIMRHFIDRGYVDEEDGVRHSAKLAWRALALLQQELEEAGESPLPRGASLPEAA